MILKRYLLAAGFLLAALSAAYPQAGQFPSGTVQGNAGASKGQGSPQTVTAILDRALGSTRGALIERGASGWAIGAPGSAGLAYVSNGAGADPAYQVLGIGGGGTNCSAASGTCLDNITGFASTGYVKRTGAGAYSVITPIAIADGGTGGATQQAALNAVMCVPMRAGDIAYWNGSNWVCFAGNNSGTQFFSENASGVPAWSTGSAALANFSAALGSNQTINQTTYADVTGLSVAQGTSGTWLVNASINVVDTGGAATVNCRLTDGTTVFASSGIAITAANTDRAQVPLSGILATPAANIKIQCKSTTTTSEVVFNNSGDGKDSVMNVVRIQ